MSINEVRYLPECGSTNAYVKEHFEEFGPVGAVYTENQTAGRGRLGRSWVNAEGKALYYTVAIREPLAQPATLPLLASLAVRTQLKLRYGVDCQIKWPNDLLLNGKKIVGILCEGVSYGYQQQGRGILCGIGINLAQPQSYFDAADLPHGTSLALQGALESAGAKAQVLTSIRMEPVGELYSKAKALELMEEGRIVIVAGGTGNPYFTTDTASALRGIEIEAEVLLKGTRVDGIYTADPEKDPTAEKFSQITFDEVYRRQLKVMDLTAFTMCKQNDLPIVVFDMDTPGNLRKVIDGEQIGTVVRN